MGEIVKWAVIVVAFAAPWVWLTWRLEVRLIQLSKTILTLIELLTEDDPNDDPGREDIPTDIPATSDHRVIHIRVPRRRAA